MRQFRIAFLVAAFSLLMAGMAFAIDIQGITTASIGGVIVPDEGLAIPAGGRGDALLGPLYDCRNLIDTRLPGPAGSTSHAQNTLIALVNTDHFNGMIGRLRFREWKRSLEVLDLDIPMSANDVWVGVVSRAPNGGCVLNSPDFYITNIADADTCAAGGVIAFTAGLFPAGGFFFNPLLIQTDGEVEPNPLARTEYGDFEFIGEEILNYHAPINEVVPPVSFARQSTAVVTDPNGVILINGRDVGNVLEGTVYIIRPDIAISHQYNMIAISNFAVNPNGIYNPPTTAFPNLLANVQGNQTCAPGAGGFFALEALLSKRFIDFQYVTGTDPTDPTATPTSTSAVVTFPTKGFHYAQSKPFAAIPIYPFLPPFTGLFETLGDTEPEGEVVGCFIWDRFEDLLSAPVIPISPSGSSGVCKLPYEVNVIGMYPIASPVLEFRNNLALATASASQTFYSGWARIDLSPPVPTTGTDTRTVRQGKAGIIFNFFNNIFTAYQGLPTIGIVMTEFYNSTVNGYFGNTVPWQYGVDWSNAVVPFLADPAPGGVSPLNPGYPF